MQNSNEQNFHPVHKNLLTGDVQHLYRKKRNTGDIQKTLLGKERAV